MPQDAPIRLVVPPLTISSTPPLPGSLAHHQARVATALRASNMGLWRGELSTGEITWAPEVYDILGCPEFNGTLEDFQQWIHQDDRAAANKAMIAAFSEGVSLSAEFRWWHQDGEWRWMLIRGQCEFDKSGVAARMFGTVQDITETHNAAEELRSSEMRFRQLAESIEEVFWLTDVDQTEIYYISPGYETVWGRTCESLFESPRQWFEAIHPDDRGYVESAFSSLQTSGYDVEYRILRPAGEIRWIRDRAFPVRDEHGTVVRIAGVAEDVTRRRELEAQLRHAQKMQSIGELAGGVAHDFNNLLTVISTAAQLLDRTLPKDAESRELVDEIRMAQQRATSLTRQLLAFSRREVVAPRVIEVDAVVVDTEKMLRRLLGEDVRLVTNLNAAGLHVRIDPGQLVQVLMNLAVNARDAMVNGGALHIRTSERLPFRAIEVNPDCGPYVELSVVDTGDGMSAEVRSRVFEPFFTTKDSGQGTGMGLSVVHGIVVQNGGHLEVFSEEGKGAAFVIYLPVVQPVAEPPQAVDSVVVNHAETVLVVEDESSVRRMVEWSKGRSAARGTPSSLQPAAWKRFGPWLTGSIQT
ncbi:MAG: PAS domain-containing protein [bacterium]